MAAVPAVRAELFTSFRGGPATTMAEDVKVRQFDSARKTLWAYEDHTRPSPGDHRSETWIWFPGPGWGVESEVFLLRGRTRVHLPRTEFARYGMMRQNRLALTVSLVGRRKIGRAGISDLYAGVGGGLFFSNFDLVGRDVGRGGQLFVGANFQSSARANTFLEFKYRWAQDVGDRHQAAGQRVKTSGNPRGNPATQVFGPHYDTQIISLAMGVRFKVRD